MGWKIYHNKNPRYVFTYVVVEEHTLVEKTFCGSEKEVIDFIEKLSKSSVKVVQDSLHEIVDIEYE